MKLNELTEPGTYIGVRFSVTSQTNLIDWCKLHNVPNYVRPQRLHTTILYSKTTLNDLNSLGKFSTPWIAKVKGLTVWDSWERPGHPQTKCLIMLLDCPQMVERHNRIIQTYGNVHGHETFIPHVTLSYNIKDFDISTLPNIADSVPTIEVTEEYKKPLAF